MGWQNEQIGSKLVNRFYKNFFSEKAAYSQTHSHQALTGEGTGAVVGGEIFISIRR